MIEVESRVVIERPVDEVFAFVADQTNAPRWQQGLVEVRRTTEGPIGVGTRHTAVRQFLGRKMELTNEYVGFEPNERVTFEADSGSMRLEASYLTEAVPRGTQLTCRMLIEPRGPMRLLQPLVARGMRKESAADDRTLKELLESEPGASPGP